MRATWLILVKDLRISLRNRSVLVLGVLAPLSLAFLLNLVFGQTGDPDAPVTFDVGVADLDGGPAAGGFVAVLDDIAGSGLFELARYDDEARARAAVDDGDVAAVWVIPPGFSTALGSGDRPELVVVADVDAPNSAAMARAVADRYATGLATAQLAGQVAVAAGVASPDDLGQVAQEAAGSPPAAELVATGAGAAGLNPTTSLTAGLALFFVFFTAGLPLLSILEERSTGTLARLLVAPIPSAAVTAAKVLAALVLGVVSLAVLMAASSVLMGAEWGPPAGALVLAAAAVLAATGIMSVAGSLARTTEQAGNLQAVVAVALGVLGGAFVPIPGSEGGVLAALQRLTPHGWFLDGLGRLRSDGFTAALPAVGVLVAMGVATGAFGLWRAQGVLRR